VFFFHFLFFSSHELSGARGLRQELLTPFTIVYKLKTLSDGAIVREWPRGYSVWMDDATSPGGYKLLQSYINEPPNEAVNDLFDVRVLHIVTYTL
jgi:Domain of unknown function (DUF1995)